MTGPQVILNLGAQGYQVCLGSGTTCFLAPYVWAFKRYRQMESMSFCSIHQTGEGDAGRLCPEAGIPGNHRSAESCWNDEILEALLIASSDTESY